MIDDLLDVSQISRGKISLRRKVVDLRVLIAAAVNALSRSITENGQRLIVNVPDRDKIYVRKYVYGSPSCGPRSGSVENDSSNNTSVRQGQRDHSRCLSLRTCGH